MARIFLILFDYCILIPFLEFTNIWETAYDGESCAYIPSLQDLISKLTVTDTTFNCEVNRTNGDSSTQMYLINHFLDKLVFGVPAPNVAAANETNSVDGEGGLGIQVQTCTAQYSRAPNFLLVDVSSCASLMTTMLIF